MSEGRELRMRYGSKWFNLGPPESLKDPSSDIITLSHVDSPQITEKGVFSQVFGKKNARRSNGRLSFAGDSLNMTDHDSPFNTWLGKIPWAMVQ